MMLWMRNGFSMQDLIDGGLLGALLLSIGFAFIFKRGFSYWLKGRPDKFQPNFYRVVDLIGGILFCAGGLMLIIRAIVGVKR
jgi:hypothetical protein